MRQGRTRLYPTHAPCLCIARAAHACCGNDNHKLVQVQGPDWHLLQLQPASGCWQAVCVWQPLNAHLLSELLALGGWQLRNGDIDGCGSWHGLGCLQGSERCRRAQRRVGQSVISICLVARDHILLTKALKSDN